MGYPKKILKVQKFRPKLNFSSCLATFSKICPNFSLTEATAQEFLGLRPKSFPTQSQNIGGAGFRYRAYIGERPLAPSLFPPLGVDTRLNCTYAMLERALLLKHVTSQLHSNSHWLLKLYI